MSPLKFGVTPWGVWERDGNNLPCFQADLAHFQAAGRQPGHLIGNGRIALSLDAWGRLRLFCMDAHSPREITPPPPRHAGAFSVTLALGGLERRLPGGDFEAAPGAAMIWGAGYVVHRAPLEFGPDAAVDAALEFVADPAGSGLVLLEIRLRLTRGAALAGTLGVSLETGFDEPGAGPHPRAPRHFCRGGVAIFTELGEPVGDVVLAGTAEWTSACEERRLQLARPVELTENQEVVYRVRFGCQRDCAVAWAQEEVEKTDVAAAKTAWAKRLLPAAPARVPELWMQEECVWNAALVHALSRQDGRHGRCLLGTGAAAVPTGRQSLTGRHLPVRDLLLAALACRDAQPELALETLRAVATRQNQAGRLPESLDATPAAELHPAVERSDLEIWFLLACGELAGRGADSASWLDEPQPFADAEPAPVWEHLRAAYHWLRDEIRTGSHGFIRILAGDWNPALRNAGVEGAGESALNTALAIVALERFAELARPRRDAFLADEAAAWAAELRRAMASAFDQKWFIRGYTDAGRPFGTVADGHLYLDVQAWAALACCGTGQQRQTALIQALGRNRPGPEAPLRLLSQPYSAPPPPELSPFMGLPGDGWNGGASLPAVAWLIQALAAQGLRDQAVPVWEAMSLRRLGRDFPGVAPSWRWALPLFSAAAAGVRAGGPGLEVPDPEPLPDLLALVWQEAALRRLTAPA